MKNWNSFQERVEKFILRIACAMDIFELRLYIRLFDIPSKQYFELNLSGNHWLSNF